MSKISFATPLPQSSRSEVLEWQFPKPYQQYVLTGKSRAAWQTSFVIPQLNLLLDAGLCVNKLRPKHIFLTHGHSDHTLLSPAFVTREDPPDIYCPAEMQKVLDDFIAIKRLLNLGGHITIEEAGRSASATDTDTDTGSEEAGNPWLKSHVTHGVKAGDTVALRRVKNFTAEVFSCHHTVPCVGYVFRMNSHRLKPEHASLSGPELKALRQSGVDITAPHSAPVFAFLGDTTAETLAAEPQWLRDGIPVVITECSFLHEEHRAQAEKTKHTIWADLEKVVRKWPKTTFVITHFSLRYNDEIIRRFFAEMADPPANLVIWVDGEPEAKT